MIDLLTPINEHREKLSGDPHSVPPLSIRSLLFRYQPGASPYCSNENVAQASTVSGRATPFMSRKTEGNGARNPSALQPHFFLDCLSAHGVTPIEVLFFFLAPFSRQYTFF
jgi:hypothetical protein